LYFFQPAFYNLAARISIAAIQLTIHLESAQFGHSSWVVPKMLSDLLQKVDIQGMSFSLLKVG